MNKFGKPNEEDYLLVLSVIEKMVEAAPDLLAARSQRNLGAIRENYRFVELTFRPAITLHSVPIPDLLRGPKAELESQLN